MNLSARQASIAKLLLVWASINLAYVLFAISVSGVDETPRTTNDIVSTVIVIVVDIVQLAFAIMLLRNFQIWIYSVSIALIPISIAVFWSLPL